jgi:sporulation protein YlmC with PRC-barrel domain
MAVPTAVAAIGADQVDGAQIYNTKGQHLGEIVDVVIDKPSGMPTYAVMSLSERHCIVETYYPIPWSVLRTTLASAATWWHSICRC